MNGSPIPIRVDELKPHYCVRCKNELFTQVYFIRVVPALLSPTGKELKQPFPAFQCTKCKTLVEFEEKKPNNLVKS